MKAAYRSDLAAIHDRAFGHLAAGAARLLIEELESAGVHAGTVVDLGCGSGILARSLCYAGYSVLGIDLSEPMVELARERVPGAEFRLGSFVTADIPPAIAVAAIGEVFNYTFDPANDRAVRKRVFERIHEALAPGGLLLCDLAGPTRAPAASPQRSFFEGEGWALLVEVEANETTRGLTRRITSFCREGKLYRRELEVHRLELVEPAEIVGALEHAGFDVEILDCYGLQPLPQGLVGFLARKAGGPGV